MPWIGITDRLVQQLDQRSNALLEQPVDQQRLVREAPVHGPHADSGVMGDVVERDAQPALREQLPGGVEDPLPVAAGEPVLAA